MADRFTLCVPTKNRPEFIARLFNYYVQTGYRHWIFIGDASDPGSAQRNRDIVESLKGKLQVRYFEQGGFSVVESLEHLSGAAATPYCGWVCDDDFLCTPGIERCIQFMESAGGGYAAAHGEGVLFQLDEPGPYGTVADVRPYPPADLEQATAGERLRTHLNRGSPSFHMAVRRTGLFNEMFKGFGRMRGARQGFIFDELILSSLAAIQGKVKVLDCLYLVRQAHEGIYRQVNGYDWITDPDWHPSFLIFRDLIAESLSKKDRIPREKADRVVKEAFWFYLAELLASSRRKQQASAGRHGTSWIRAAAKNLPGLKSAWRWLRLKEAAPFLVSRSWLRIRESSPLYQADFAPVVRAVTQLPPEPQMVEAAHG